MIYQKSPTQNQEYLFADDTKLYRRIEDKKDCDQLQKDLNALQAWSDKWLLQFHPDKCVTMRVGNAVDPQIQYTLGTANQHALKSSIQEKDIGVTFESKLTFEKHMSEKINKALWE